MKVKALRKFRDLKAGVMREKGAVFEVTEKRYRELNSTMHGALVEPVEESEESKEELKLEAEEEEQPDG